MDARLNRTALGPADVTLDATESVAGLAHDSSVCSGPQCRVHLVEGSNSGRTGETEDLLRSRLRSAALLSFTGFAAFLVWHVTRVQFTSWVYVATFFDHIATTFILGAIAFSLSTRCPMTTRQLRWIELVTFGVPIAFFMLLLYSKLTWWTANYSVLPEVSLACWLLQIFIYALFIPNTWKRAAVVIGLMAVAPIVSLLVTMGLHADIRNLVLADPQFLVEMTLVLSIATVAAVFGVYTINGLRDEVLRARQLGQYKLKRLIGSGGMGDVYLAEHLLMKRPCAIKVIRPEKAGDPKVLARFEREVQATAKLSHWNSVDIFDYGRADD
ncbi:MAG TPA: serine/threonine protein kinase, partial [Pirellulaceae bacterium]|nr:serine/threonine protein kinase [Pirellulaceae bacterium]